MTAPRSARILAEHNGCLVLLNYRYRSKPVITIAFAERQRYQHLEEIDVPAAADPETHAAFTPNGKKCFVLRGNVISEFARNDDAFVVESQYPIVLPPGSPTCALAARDDGMIAIGTLYGGVYLFHAGQQIRGIAAGEAPVGRIYLYDHSLIFFLEDGTYVEERDL